MKARITILIIIVAVLFSGCTSKYNGPYADMPLLTKEAVKKQIDLDNSIIKSKTETLIKQVKAKSDIKYYQMLILCYEFYEAKIKAVDGKKFMITATSVNQFIKSKKFEANLKQIESDSKRWPTIFLGNMARYFYSIGFTISVDGSSSDENIVLSW
jgi:hypothetical protein